MDKVERAARVAQEVDRPFELVSLDTKTYGVAFTFARDGWPMIAAVNRSELGVWLALWGKDIGGLGLSMVEKDAARVGLELMRPLLSKSPELQGLLDSLERITRP